jgi:polyhydroxyalkanoate synthase subunit PhaC
MKQPAYSVSGKTQNIGHTADALLHGRLAAVTHGISPMAISNAYSDWIAHLAASPSKQLALADQGRQYFSDWLLYVLRSFNADCQRCIEPLPQDKRFHHPSWEQAPFNWISQGFLSCQHWWHQATTNVRGVSCHHEQLVEFMTRQWLDVWSPSNTIATNPEVLALTIDSGGSNLVEGFANWWQDATNLLANRMPAGTEAFLPGKAVAITPGKVVFRNDLIELIQYAPQTPSVYPEPLLMIPSWIMKFYILDLSPANSLVKYMVDAGFTVFMISWKNPGSEDSDLSMDDYLKKGVLTAIDKVAEIFPQRPFHALGYCLGGTMLAIAAAYLVKENDQRLKTLTLLAASLDFEEPGQLGLFIDESQIAFLEDTMQEQGYLDGKQMAGAFALINSKDLVWSKLVHEYLQGKKTPVTDLRSWNADATRMPYRMQSEYLRRLYMDNALAEGSYTYEGQPIALKDIKMPLFVVSTERDHVSPWKSVYKTHYLTDSKITFVLTTGGHNVGIVNPPGPELPKRGYRIAVKLPGSEYVDPDTWYATNSEIPGSWWPAWLTWLISQSGHRIPATASQSRYAHAPTLAEASGTYVHQR